MAKHIHKLVALIFPLIALLGGCSTTKMMDHWQAEEFKRDQMKKVLVVAVTSNTTHRILFETGFVSELTAKGINATASYSAIGDSTPTREAIEEYIKNGKHDHVVVASVGDVQTDTDVVPESVRTYYTGYMGPAYGTWGGYWGAGNTTTLTRSSYVDTQTNIILTTVVYNLETEQLAWSGRSKTFEVSSVSHLANELAKQMVRNMK